MFTMGPPPVLVVEHSSDEVFRTTLQPSMSADVTTCVISTTKRGKTVNTAGKHAYLGGKSDSVNFALFLS